MMRSTGSRRRRVVDVKPRWNHTRQRGGATSAGRRSGGRTHMSRASAPTRSTTRRRISCRLVGEGDRHDLPRSSVTLGQYVRDAPREHPRLARAGGPRSRAADHRVARRLRVGVRSVPSRSESDPGALRCSRRQFPKRLLGERVTITPTQWCPVACSSRPTRHD